MGGIGGGGGHDDCFWKKVRDIFFFPSQKMGLVYMEIKSQ